MKRNKRYLSIIFVLCFLSIHTFAQTHRIDSLQNEIKKPHKDSVLVFIYTGLANELFAYDTIKALQYLEQGYLLAKKMNYDYALGDYYQVKGMSKQFTSDHELANSHFDSAIFYFNKVINSKRSKEEIETARLAKATSLGQKADILSKRGKSEEAITTYITTLEAWKASDDERKNQAVAIYYTKISSIYYGLKQFDKALNYDKLSLSAFLKENNEESIAWAYLYVCQDFIQLNQMDSSVLYLAKAKPLVLRLNNHRLNFEYYDKQGTISSKKNDYRTAISYHEKALAEAKFENYKFRTLSTQRAIGFCYVRLGEYDAARKILLTALPAAIAGTYTDEKMRILQELATVEEKTKNPTKALNYLKEVLSLRDSINLDNSKKAVAEIENKYQSAEKEKEILKLNADKQIQVLSLKQKSILNYILIGSVAALFIISFVGYRNIRHRQQISKQQNRIDLQRINELEKDKQLVAVDSIIRGQEEERSRLAKDLHDGLGGLLSGVKFSLSNMKDNLIITPDNMSVFERSLDLIDTSIKELRRVAQNMMPEMLTKFGLNEALKEYCNTINSAKLVTVKYQSLGMETRLDKSIEIIIFRIVQESLNNIMKHAAASEAFVQIIRDENRLNIVVEDNGKGFDTGLIENNIGAGLSNVRSRVDYLKGQLDVHSEVGKGTLINIEFNI
jgi:signal transduction histidine kinase